MRDTPGLATRMRDNSLLVKHMRYVPGVDTAVLANMMKDTPGMATKMKITLGLTTRMRVTPVLAWPGNTWPDCNPDGYTWPGYKYWSVGSPLLIGRNQCSSKSVRLTEPS